MSFLNRFLSRPEKDDALGSVVRNLTHLLSARAGYGSPLCDLGIGAHYQQQGAQGAALALMQEILDVIAAYEPRLRAHDIQLVDQLPDLTMVFELQVELRRPPPPPISPFAQQTRHAQTPRKAAKPARQRLRVLFDPVLCGVTIEPVEDSVVH